MTFSLMRGLSFDCVSCHLPFFLDLWPMIADILPQLRLGFLGRHRGGAGQAFAEPGMTKRLSHMASDIYTFIFVLARRLSCEIYFFCFSLVFIFRFLSFDTQDPTYGQTDRQTDRQTYRRTDGRTDRQTDRQTDRRTYTQTHISRDNVLDAVALPCRQFVLRCRGGG